ncbi:hypothetical protein Pcinc_010978 [Petrolisthes cinctipes]|uniref:Gag-like protein n=1 Tax=Petrolisthes cinctipes TaxID=88211 RepID=A0AAE1G4I1_PETCI|nr:hypothetical protein Pcinc_010978 [Petrolisthes cinctipes]
MIGGHEAATTAHSSSLKTSIVTSAITLANEDTATIIQKEDDTYNQELKNHLSKTLVNTSLDSATNKIPLDNNSISISDFTSEPSSNSQHDMNGWTEVKSKSSKKKEHQVKNIQEQENSAHTSQFTKLLITPTQHFKTAYNVVDALEKEHPTLKFHLKITPAGNVLITPPDAHTFHLLKNITELNGKPIRFIPPPPPTISAILLHYPIALPLQPILNHPKVIEDKRCIHSSGIPTMQIQFTITGPLPPYLKLGNWGTFYTRPYIKEPLRCFKCQRFGHHKAHCHQREVCAVCSSPHATEACLKKLKEQQPTTAKCPNCKMDHHAWYRNCPTRRALVQAGKEKQAAWVITNKPTPATTKQEIVQQQQNHQVQQPPICIPSEFPTIQEAMKPGRKMTCSQTASPMKYSQAVSQQPLQTTSTPIPVPPKTTQKSILSQLTTPPPPQTTDAEDHMLEPQEQKSVQRTQPSSSTFQGTVADHSPKNQAQDSVEKLQPSSSTLQETVTLTKADLRDLLQNFALALAGLINTSIDKEKLTQMCDTVVNNTIRVPTTISQTQASPRSPQVQSCNTLKEKSLVQAAREAPPFPQKAPGLQSKHQTATQSLNKQMLQGHQNKPELQVVHGGALEPPSGWPVVPELGEVNKL